MKLRKVTMHDAQNLFEWRNDPVTCKNSMCTEPISWQEHLKWLAHSLAMSTRLLFIAEDENGASIGTCRADLETDESGNVFYHLSWTVAPQYRGKGFGKKMVQELLFLEQLQGKVIRADIKEGNVPSIHIAISCGFTKSPSLHSELIRFSRPFMPKDPLVLDR